MMTGYQDINPINARQAAWSSVGIKHTKKQIRIYMSHCASFFIINNRAKYQSYILTAKRNREGVTYIITTRLYRKCHFLSASILVAGSNVNIFVELIHTNTMDRLLSDSTLCYYVTSKFSPDA